MPPCSLWLTPWPPFHPFCRSDVADDLFPVETADDVRTLKSMIQRHLKFTGSDVARRILLGWDKSRAHFKKVFPREYRCGELWRSRFCKRIVGECTPGPCRTGNAVGHVAVSWPC